MKLTVSQFLIPIFRLLCVGLLLVCQSSIADGEKTPAPSRIAVLFPQLQAPYDQIFKTITDGVDDAHVGSILRLELPASADSAELSRTLTRENPDAVIALGTRSV